MAENFIDLTKQELALAKSKQLADDSRMVEAILQHVANGGTLADLAKMWGFDYSSMRRELHQHYKAEWEAAKEARMEFKQEKIIKELEDMAYADPTRIFDDEGNLLPLSEWPDDVRKSVASLDVHEVKDPDGEVTSIIKKIKMNPKIKALELMAKEAKMLVDKVEVDVKHIDIGKALEEAKSRVVEGIQRDYAHDNIKRLPTRDDRSNKVTDDSGGEGDT